MIKISPQYRKIIELLLQSLIRDLGSETQISDCGWVSDKEIETKIIFDKNSLFYPLIQKDLNKGIRLNFIDDNDPNNFFIPYDIKLKLDKNFNQLAKQLDYLLSLKNEDYKLSSSIRIIEKMAGRLSDSRFSLSMAIFLGIYRMLENSGLPAPMNDVFVAKLNPKEWIQDSTDAIPCLSYQLIQQLDQNFTWSKFIENYEKTPIKILRGNPSEMKKSLKNLDKIESILQWSKIKSKLDDDTLSSMGLNWYMLDLLETTNFLPQDSKSLIRVHDLIELKIESLLKIDLFEIFKRYDIFVQSCENENITWGTEIFFFPEVV